MGSVTFLPNGAVTGIGSLPISDPQDAVGFVAKYCPVIPFWPQLPARSPQEYMIEQFLSGFETWLEPRLGAYGYAVRAGCLDDFLDRLENSSGALDVHYAAGFFAFEQALRAGAFPYAIAVKGQITGPISLGFQLFNGSQPFVYDPQLLAALTHYIARSARWQIERLKAFASTVLLFIDEPCLGLSQITEMPANEPIEHLEGLIRTIKRAGGVSGLHCCATVPSERMLRVNADILSFDAYQYLEMFTRNDNFRLSLAGNGITAYGLIPTLTDLSQLSSQQITSRWLLAMSGAAEIRNAAQHTMTTATCGLGLLDTKAACQSFELAQEVARFIKRLV